ncbi:MAG: S1 RNA-binding domain-containing protein [Candidatus Lokiarchaeota archaeon]|nr:S1 RNA-binding domain-containing protein [Candidatus Lokiarchaeota archaeon]
MVRNRTPFPKVGDFIIGRAVNVEQQYIYVDLTDYEGLPSEEFARGMIHISEISSRWIKNIRNFVRIGQVIVLRVLKVDPSKGHIDLSLRRVNSAQKKKVAKERKYAVKFDNILQFLTETEGVNMTLDEAWDQIGWPLLDNYKFYQETIETLKENGDEIIAELLDIPEDIKKIFMQIINENVEITTVRISGKIKLVNRESDGIDRIKDTLTTVAGIVENPRETRKLDITYLGAPYYRMEVISKDYLNAEGIISDVIDTLDAKIEEHKGAYEFIRD